MSVIQNLTPEQQQAAEAFRKARDDFSKAIGMPCMSAEACESWDVPHSKDVTHRYSGVWLLFVYAQPEVINRKKRRKK